MSFIVPLAIASVNDVRWRWLTAGVLGAPSASGVSQVGTFLLFRIDTGDPPDDAEELIVYDVNDTTNYALAGYASRSVTTGDPLATELPGSYADHTAGAILSKLDIGTPSEPVVTVPGPAAPNQITGYTTTRDEHGVIKPAIPLTFQLTAAAPNRASSYSTKPFTATSDINGSLSITLEKGAIYTVKRGKAGTPISFAAPTSGATFALPEVLGIP